MGTVVAHYPISLFDHDQKKLEMHFDEQKMWKDFEEKDLFVFISYSGATKDNVQTAKIAKERGAHVVCISHFQKSPLTAYCDIVLLCGSKEGPLDRGSMSAKAGQLYLIDLLYQSFYERNLNVSVRNNELTAASVVEKSF